jgi:glycosyltransferase involved in cell wall biosynthesis
VLLWGGGIYDWFDPLTLIRAVAKVSEKHDDLRLFFLATQHANSAHATMKMAVDSIQLSKDLGAYGKTVFFNEAWVPHNERANYFLDADIGVSTHLDHLETSYSFRTRLLDYIWAGLPIINSAGDAFEQAIVERNLGVVVAPGDVDALAEAIETLVYDTEASATVRRNVTEFGPELHWAHATEALVRFCQAPYHAADDDLITGRRLAEKKLVKMDAQQSARTSIQVQELKNRVRDLESSTSWRVTAPLRAVTQLLKRG